MIDLSIVIPTYTRGAVIASHIEQIREQLLHDPQKLSFEIIAVNDCSPDDTERVLWGLCQKYPELQVLTLSENRGQQISTLAGLRASTGSIVITMDDDGKDQPGDIPRLIACLQEGYDVVYGIQNFQTPADLHRKIGTKVKNLLIQFICRLPETLELSAFRAMTRTAADRVCQDQRQSVYISAALLQTPIRVGQITVALAPTQISCTGYTLQKRVKLLLQIFLYYGPFQKLLTSSSQKDQYTIRSRFGRLDKLNRAQQPVKPKKLMMLGASLAQLPGILAAKKLGFEVVTCDYLPHAIGHSAADICEYTSSFDEAAVLLAAQRHSVDGLMTMGSDQPVYTAAWVAEQLNKPSLLSAQTARFFTDKRVMKHMLRENQLPTVPYVIYRKHECLSSDSQNFELEKLKYPVVIKPVDSQGQRGIFVVNSAQDVVKRASEVLKFSRTDEILAESYYPSDEVTVSGWVKEGKANLLTLTDRVTFQTLEQIGICLSHEWPSRHQALLGTKIEQLTQRIVTAAGLQDGPVYFQLLIGDQGILINEIASRIGGAFESQFIPKLTGFDPTTTQILLSLGEEVSQSTWDTLENYNFRQTSGALSVQLFFANPCTIAALTPLQDLMNCAGVIDAGYHLSVGQTIAAIDNATARVGYCIVEADTQKRLEKRLELLYLVLRIEDENGVNQVIHRPIDSGGLA